MAASIPATAPIATAPMARSERPGPPARRFRVSLTLLAIAGLAAAISACAPPDPRICPRVAVLGDAARLVKFVPGAPQTEDNVMYTVRMTDVSSDCTYRGSTSEQMENNLRVAVEAERGPALRSNTVETEYFVAVLDRAGNVLNKRIMSMTLDFGGSQRISTVEETWQLFDLKGGGGGPSYEIWSGLQLTDSEVDFNRRQETGN